MNRIAHPSAIAVALSLSTPALSGLTDFYVSSTSGEIYRVDGNTLDATEIVQLQNAGSMNEILYLGNGRIAANLTFSMDIYDINTGTQQQLFEPSDITNPPSTPIYTSGLALLQNGDIYVSYNDFVGNAVGTSYDLTTQSFEILAQTPGVAFTDHHQLSTGEMLAANINDESIHIYNPLTGDQSASINIGHPIVSFMEQGDQLFYLTQFGDLYTFDIQSGNTQLYGSITSTTGSLIGMTIPSPTPLLTLTTTLLLTTRRRR